MQAYEKPIDKQLCFLPTQNVVFYTYKNKCETFSHTATLLIHIQKYLAVVSNCFTKEKNEGTV